MVIRTVWQEITSNIRCNIKYISHRKDMTKRIYHNKMLIINENEVHISEKYTTAED